jgi:hypothetical protein
MRHSYKHGAPLFIGPVLRILVTGSIAVDRMAKVMESAELISVLQVVTMRRAGVEVKSTPKAPQQTQKKSAEQTK